LPSIIANTIHDSSTIVATIAMTIVIVFTAVSTPN